MTNLQFWGAIGFAMQLVFGLLAVAFFLAAIIVFVQEMVCSDKSLPKKRDFQMGAYQFAVCMFIDQDRESEHDPLTYCTVVWDYETERPVNNLVWRGDKKTAKRQYNKMVKDFCTCADWVIDLLGKKEAATTAH